MKKLLKFSFFMSFISVFLLVAFISLLILKIILIFVPEIKVFDIVISNYITGRY